MRNKFILILFLAAFSSAGYLYAQRPFHHRMAAFVTDLEARSVEQRINIERVGEVLSGTIVNSGQVFSLNETAGPYTEARGFLPERTYLEKRNVDQAGGGVCQVASTLYNAGLKAGLQVVERVPHSGQVHSVPKGRDAPVPYGIADLKLKNPYPFPVKIVSSVAQGQLKIEIWGKEIPHESIPL